MFSTTSAGAAEEISPPRKRRKKLDIADVSCLVATRQKAAFHSPEKPAKEKQSACSESALSKKPQPTAVEVDFLSQEVMEEDAIIQSSLPQYLDHVFGSCIGNSQPSDRDSQTHIATCKPDGGQCDSPTVIDESQGFIVRGLSDELPNVVTPGSIESESFAQAVKNESPANTELSPLLFQSPTSPHDSISGVHTYSQALTLNHIQHTCTPSTPCNQKSAALLLPEVSVAVPQAPDVSASKCGRKSNRKRKLSSTKTAVKKTNYTCPPSCVSLMDCSQMKTESIVSILALILQVNAVMEVACKRGAMAGRTVPVSSVLLADPTKSCLKLLLWREAACWVERIVAGDFVYFSSIRLKSWQEEIVGHTIMYSRVLNLHQPKKSLPSKLLEKVPMESLQCLLEWGKSRHGYLFRDTQPIPSSQRPVYFRTSDELGLESVIHFRAKLVAIISDRVVQLSDRPGKDVFLYLELSEGVGHVWELQYLAVALEGTQSNYSLQVTSRSQLRRLSVESIDAQDVLERFPPSSQSDYISVLCSISSLLQCRSSGVVKCKAKAMSFNFQLMDGCVLTLHSLGVADLCGLELVSQLLQAVYVGCEACAKPLTQDVNHVYFPCGGCAVKTPGGHLSSAYYYRPLVIGLCDDSAALEVVANQVVVSKLLGGVEAADLVRTSLAQNVTQSGALKEAVVRLLGSDDSDSWTLNVAFAVDEFSFVESLTVSLLDRTA